MSLRVARSMADVARPRDPHDELASSATASDVDDDDIDSDYLHYDFPQPPSIDPVLRRMRSSPWYSQQLMALSKPERRHSVSPLIHHRPGPSPRDAQISRELVRMGLLSLDPPKNDDATSEPTKPPVQPDHLPSRRLPPPAPAPSIPLPHLPRIIRKVASMRSESRQELFEPAVSSRRPVPKIRSLKFMSGSVPGSNPLQSARQGDRKRSWSFSRPTSFQRTKDVPVPSIEVNNASGHLSASLDRAHLAHVSPTAYSNLYSIGSHIDDEEDRHHRHFSRGNLDLSSSLAPRYAHRTVWDSGSTFNAPFGENTLPGSSCGPSRAGPSIRQGHAGLSQHRTPHRIDVISGGSRGNSGALLHDAKSFINITPERRKSRPKSGTKAVGPGNGGGGMGQQVGSAMKAKGEKMKRLFARASNGVVDWGRQLTGRTAKSVSASSTSGSLAPLTGLRS